MPWGRKVRLVTVDECIEAIACLVVEFAGASS